MKASAILIPLVIVVAIAAVGYFTIGPGLTLQPPRQRVQEGSIPPLFSNAPLYQCPKWMDEESMHDTKGFLRKWSLRVA